MSFFQDDPEPPTDPREQAFHNMIRENVIFLLIGMTLYGCSYGLISNFRRKKDDVSKVERPKAAAGVGNDHLQVAILAKHLITSTYGFFSLFHSCQQCYADEEDALVYRISHWMCYLSLATSIGSALLLPFSIVTNEVLLLYPDSYYIQWLNESLVQGLWNYVFLLSNISLFVLLPFAYFFTESEGFSGSKKGIMARVNEAVVLLMLLAVLILGMTYLLCSVLGYNDMNFKNLLLMWHYLPFLYSCVSFLGVLLLLLCTPVGIGKLSPFFRYSLTKTAD